MRKILAPLKLVLSDSLFTYDPHNYSLIQENFNILLDAFLLSLYSLWYRYPLILTSPLLGPQFLISLLILCSHLLPDSY